MGFNKTGMRLSNPTRPDAAFLDTDALGNPAALLLCIPVEVAAQLHLATLHERLLTLADGSTRMVPYVGPVKIEVANRACFTGALVCGAQVLLGTITMEEMNLVLIPSTRRVIPRPTCPNFGLQ